jgi:hypothetical protein
VGELSASVRLKLDRAHEHLDALKRLVAPWGERDQPDAYRFVTEIEDDTDPFYVRFRYLIRIFSPLPTDELSKILGDSINNFRCVLDHLIWELSALHSGTNPPNPMGIKFPARPSGHGSGGLHAVSSQVVADVQWLHAHCAAKQPGDPSPFTMLCELSNVDKHSAIHFVNHHPRDVQVDTVPPIIGTRVEIVDQTGTLEDGTVIARIAIPRPMTMAEEVKVHARTEHGVVIAKTSRTPMAHLGMTIDGIEEAVTQTAERLRHHLP